MREIRNMRSETTQALFEEATQDIHSIIIEIEAMPVDIKTIEGELIRVQFPEPKSSDIISSEIHDGNYVFRHEIKKFKFPYSGFCHFHKKVIVELSRSFHGNFFIKASNGALLIDELPELTETKFVTTNAAITIQNLKCNSALIQTINGAVKIDNIESSNIELETCNGSISGTIKGDIRDYGIESRTTNASNNLPEYLYQGQPKVLKSHNKNGKIDIKFVR